MIYLGIDPGLSGGLAALSTICTFTGFPRPMPLAGGEIDALNIAETVTDLRMADDVIVCVEAVHSMPKQGVASTFKFGKGYGMVLGALAAVSARTELVTPQAWKKAILAGTAKDKDAAIAWCRRAYPSVNLLATERSRVPHDGIADALCIAEYARRTYK